jgi:hypothetical protein
MLQGVLGALVMAAGLVVAGVGLAVAHGRLSALQRRAHRAALREAAALDGWSAWFAGGFTGFALGLQSLAAVAVWIVWTVAGACLIGLGIRLVSG